MDTAKRHAAGICDEVELRLYQSVKQSIGDETIARRLISSQLKPALSERKTKLLEKIDGLYAPYALGGLLCMSRIHEDKGSGYIARLVADKTLTDTRSLFGKTQFCYHLVLDTFVENFIQLGVENCLPEDLREIFTTSDLDDTEVEQLASELPEIKYRRTTLQSEKVSYSKAVELIAERSVNSAFWDTTAQVNTLQGRHHGLQIPTTTTQIHVSPATPIQAFMPNCASQMNNLDSSKASSRSSSSANHRSSVSLSSATSYEPSPVSSPKC